MLKKIILLSTILFTTQVYAQNIISTNQARSAKPDTKEYDKKKGGIIQVFPPPCAPPGYVPAPYSPAPGLTVYPSPGYRCYAPQYYGPYNPYYPANPYIVPPNINNQPNYYQPQSMTPEEAIGYGLGSVFGYSR